MALWHEIQHGPQGLGAARSHGSKERDDAIFAGENQPERVGKGLPSHEAGSQERGGLRTLTSVMGL